jgi:hypothetical protein
VGSGCPTYFSTGYNASTPLARFESRIAAADSLFVDRSLWQMKLRCPKCSAGFEATATPDNVVGCPNCGAKLKSPTPPPAAAAAKPAPKSVIEAPAELVPGDDELRPRKRKKIARRRRTSGSPVSIAGLVVIAVVGVGAYFAYRHLPAILLKNDISEVMRQEQREKNKAIFGEDVGDPSRVRFEYPESFSLEKQPKAYSPPSALPEIGAPVQVQAGVHYYAAKVGDDVKTDVRVYLPASKPATGKMPIVFMPTMGSNGLCGAPLSEHETLHHFVYANQGFAVVAYSLSGFAPASPTTENVMAAITAYHLADGGMHDAKNAMAWAFGRFPDLDQDRMFAAGSYSGGTSALLLAANEPRIKGVAVYDAYLDLDAKHPNTRHTLRERPGGKEFFRKINPRMNERRIKCPVFLYDGGFMGEAEQAQVRLKSYGNADVTVFSKFTQDEKSVVTVGMPKAVAWLMVKARLK